MKELDSKDHKILYQLYLNSRQSLSYIGKRVGLPKNVVKYRIDRLESRGIIKNYNAMIDVFKLGYSVYKLNFVFQYASPEKEKEIIKFFANYENTWNASSSKGRYDFITTILVKNQNHFYSFYEDILKKYRNYLKEIYFSQLYEKFGYKHGILFDEKSSEVKAYEYRYDGKTIDIDNIDYKILGLLAHDCRMRSIDIAKEVNLTSTSVINRINKLINSKIIQRYSTTFDTNKLGYKSFIVNLSLRNYDVKNKIIRYLSGIPFIWEIYKAIGGCDIEIALFTLNFEHFYLLMEELRNKFPDDITFYDYLHITEVHKTNHLPQNI